MQRTAITNIILSAREVTGLWHMLHWEKQSKVKYISKIISLCMTNVDGMVWYGRVSCRAWHITVHIVDALPSQSHDWCKKLIHRISSNRSQLSNTSRESDCLCSNSSRVSNTSQVSHRTRGLTANTIELMVLVIGPWCVASFVTYYSTWLWHPMFEKAKKSHFKNKIRSRWTVWF